MWPYLKGVLLFALIAVAAFVASAVLVGDIVPIAGSDQPQPHLQLAFVLKTIKLTSVGGLVLVLISALPAWLTRRSETRAVR